MKTGIMNYLNLPCIAAHRGSCGGNIPPNTIAAYDAALYQGAEILEADIARSSDGVFYMFHTGSGNEEFYLGIDCAFENLTSKDLDNLYLNNEFRKATQYRLDRFDDILTRFKGRGIFNLDRAWEYWEELIPLIKSHGMEDQVLLKSPCEAEWIQKAKKLPPQYAYMPIISENIDTFYELGGDSIPGYCGAELVFSSEESPVISRRTVEVLHKSKKLAWGNGIRFSREKNLNAGHGDDVSITGDPDSGWGWLIDQGFDIIQTDWVQSLSNYILNLYGRD